MPKWKMKLVGQARIYRYETIEAPDLDSAVEQAEITFHDTEDGWTIDSVNTRGPDAVQVVVNSWKLIVE